MQSMSDVKLGLLHHESLERTVNLSGAALCGVAVYLFVVLLLSTLGEMRLGTVVYLFVVLLLSTLGEMRLGTVVYLFVVLLLSTLGEIRLGRSAIVVGIC